MSKFLKYTLATLLILIVLWFFFLRGAGATGYPGEGVPGVDPYMEIRSISGPYSDKKWRGADMTVNSDGFWIIAEQDYGDFPITRVHSAMQAFIKGYNIHPNTWQLRSALADDFREFLLENEGIHPDVVSVGQFLKPF